MSLHELFWYEGQNVSTQFLWAVGHAAFIWMMSQSTEYVKADTLTPSFYGYAGFVIAVIFSNLGAAYVAIKTLDVGMQAGLKYFSQYHTSNALSCFQGIIELAYVVVNLVWATGLSFAGYYLGYAMWATMVKLEKANAGLSTTQGLKYLTLGLEMAAGAALAAYYLGNQAATTIGYVSSYNTALDLTGSSFIYDISYHTAESLLSLLGLSAVAFGGFWLTFIWE